MSYILDSLKKSENDRKTTDNVSAISIQSPEFLKNDKPERVPYIKIGFILFLLIIIVLIVYFFIFNKPLKSTVILNDSVNAETAIPFDSANTKTNPQDRTIEQPENVSSQIPNNVSDRVIQEQQNLNKSLAKEKANTVALYQKAIEEKKQLEVDSIYKQLPDSQIQAQQQAQKQTQAQAQASNQKNSQATQDTASTATTDSMPDEIVSQESVSSSSQDTVIPEAGEEPIIQSIYELDPVFKRNIPVVNYGAHIYASDNKSGFVILNGARRRIGDQLDNGIYIEKIRSEDVVLSYNGTVFSLPAMKNWEGY